MQYLLGCLGLLVLLLLSAFFSGAETAVFHLPKVTIAKLVKYHPKFSILREREKLLGTILFGNTIVNVGAAIIATALFYQLFETLTPGRLTIVTGIMTYLILVFGEFAPKLYSLRNSERVALKSVFWLKVVRYILLPITIPIETLISFIRPGKPVPITRGELTELIKSKEEKWYLTEGEREIIMRLLDFKDKKVGDIMTPKHKLECLSISTSLGRISISTLSHSRIPVYHGSPDYVVGILYLKDLLGRPHLQVERGQSTIGRIMREPYFVSESMSATLLFSQFREKRVHIAVVVDESESAVGVVTLDDILNAIIGKI